MSDKRTEPSYIVPGLVRGIEMLRLFSPERRSLTAPEVVRELGLARATAFRVLQTLEHLGLLERSESGNGYRLGAGVLSLGFEYLASLDLTEIGRPYIERLRDRTGFSSHLVIRDGRDVVVIVKADSRAAFASSLNIGARLPAHGTVLGRVILAEFSQAALRDLYDDRGLPAFTAKTPRTIDDLEQLLGGDRERGYAVSEGFFESGISSVAAPVRGASGDVIAAVNITISPAKTVTDEHIRPVVETASALSGALSPHSSREAGLSSRRGAQ